jgi:hypothetical protein
VTSVALYLIDLEGTHLRRLAGSEEFPDSLAAPLAIGPELPREGLAPLRALIARELPGSVLAPLSLRGRALGVLLAVDAPADALTEPARQAAASLALAARYTDVFDRAQRRRQTSPAAEIQQNLLPPRIARITGARLAGNVLPGYEIGGDWFDYVENLDGGWLGVANSMGSGTTAAAIGAVALGAFRQAQVHRRPARRHARHPPRGPRDRHRRRLRQRDHRPLARPIEHVLVDRLRRPVAAAHRRARRRRGAPGRAPRRARPRRGGPVLRDPAP